MSIRRLKGNHTQILYFLFVKEYRNFFELHVRLENYITLQKSNIKGHFGEMYVVIL